MKSVVWQTIKGYEDYQVSNAGMVKRVASVVGSQGMKVLKPSKRSGYFYVVLFRNGKRKNKTIHRLVLEAFHPIKNIDIYVAHHKDGNKLNNTLENLGWRDKFFHNGMHHSGIFCRGGNPNSKLIESCVIKIKKLLNKQSLTQQQIANIFNVNQRTISAIKCGVRWNETERDVHHGSA